jgi:outer membrane protein
VNRFARVVGAIGACLILLVFIFDVPAGAQQPVSDARVKELMAQAQGIVQGQIVQGQAAGQTAPTGRVVNLTMEEAVRMATDQNIDLAVARMNPKLQDLSLSATYGAYRPTLSSTFSRNVSTSAGTSTISGGSVIDTGTFTYNGGVNQVLPWTGGSVGLAFNNTRTFSNNTTSNYNPNYSSNLNLSFSQSLLQNFRIDSTRQSIQTGKINRGLADVSLKTSTLTTIANTRNAYWDLVYAVQAVDAAKASLALAEQLVSDNRVRVEVGTLAPIDVISAQAQAALSRQTLVAAQATLKTNELSFKRLIVASTQDPIWTATINPVDRPPATAEPLDVEGTLRWALENRTDVITARENLKISDISLRYSKNQTLPSLGLSASYRAAGNGGPRLDRTSLTGGGVAAIIPGGYLDALTTLRKLLYPTWNVQLTFSYPIGISAADANLARAKVQYQQSLLQLNSLYLRVATDIANAAMTVQSSLEQVQAAGVSRELSQKKLDAAQSKFDVGMATNYEVIQAQRDLDDARNSELRAILNYRKALVNYQLVKETGSGSVSTVSSGSSGSSSSGGSGSSSSGGPGSSSSGGSGS